MGTRLYVQTKNALTLDMLADVPRGTYEKHAVIRALPDSIWERQSVRNKLARIMDHKDAFSYKEEGMTALEALESESKAMGTPWSPSVMSILWMMYVVSQDIRTMDSFLSEGFGRIQSDDDYLIKITGVPYGYSCGGTKIFTQVARILADQAKDNRLIFNPDGWTVQSLTYTGDPYVGWGNSRCQRYHSVASWT